MCDQVQCGHLGGGSEPEYGTHPDSLQPSELPKAVKELLLEAIVSAGPTPALTVPGESGEGSVIRTIATYELGCLLFKAAVLASPALGIGGLAGCALLFAFSRIKSDQSRRVGYHKNRTEVVQHGGNDWIN